MKTLFVLRHAKAKPDTSAASDFERALNKRGQKAAREIGRLIRARGQTFDAILASPAVRVAETIAGVLEGSGRAVEPAYDRRLYNASSETLLELVREIDDRTERLLIVGHNPGLQDFVLRLAEGGGEDLLGEVASGFPTAALAEIQLPVEHWREIGPATGKIVSLVVARDLADG